MMSTMKADYVNYASVANETIVDSAWYRSCDSDSDSSSETSSTSFSWADLDSDDEEMDFSMPLVLGDIDAAVRASQRKEEEVVVEEPAQEIVEVEVEAPSSFSILNSEAATFVPRRRQATQDVRAPATKVFTNGKPQNGHPEFTIFVKGFSYRVSADDLEIFFSPCGYVTKVAAPKDSRGRSRRIAWITFADEDSFQAALTMHGQKLTRTLSGKTVDCTLRVCEAQSRR